MPTGSVYIDLPDDQTFQLDAERAKLTLDPIKDLFQNAATFGLWLPDATYRLLDGSNRVDTLYSVKTGGQDLTQATAVSRPAWVADAIGDGAGGYRPGMDFAPDAMGPPDRFININFPATPSWTIFTVIEAPDYSGGAFPTGEILSTAAGGNRHLTRFAYNLAQGGNLINHRVGPAATEAQLSIPRPVATPFLLEADYSYDPAAFSGQGAGTVGVAINGGAFTASPATIGAVHDALTVAMGDSGTGGSGAGLKARIYGIGICNKSTRLAEGAAFRAKLKTFMRQRFPTIGIVA